jgi:hypothetical protein
MQGITARHPYTSQTTTDNHFRGRNWRCIAPFMLVFILSGCGGGGGGDDNTGTSGLTYSGNTQAALLDNQNAAVFADHLLSGSQFASSINALRNSNEQPTHPHNQLSIASLLTRRISSIQKEPTLNGASRPSTASRAVDELSDCNGSGSLHVQGEIQDNGTGQLTLTFNNCNEDSEILNGAMSIDVRAFDFDFQEPVNFTLEFSNLSLVSGDVRLSMGGTIQVERNIFFSTENMTVNLLTRDDNSGLMVRLQNVYITSASNLGGNFDAYRIDTFTGRL